MKHTTTTPLLDQLEFHLASAKAIPFSRRAKELLLTSSPMLYVYEGNGRLCVRKGVAPFLTGSPAEVFMFLRGWFAGAHESIRERNNYGIE